MATDLGVMTPEQVQMLLLIDWADGLCFLVRQNLLGNIVQRLCPLFEPSAHFVVTEFQIIGFYYHRRERIPFRLSRELFSGWVASYGLYLYKT